MLRFTIRELVLVTLVVAMGVAWWLEHQSLQSRHSATVKHAERLREILIEAKQVNEAMARVFDKVQFQFSYSSLTTPDWSIVDEPIPQ